MAGGEGEAGCRGERALHAAAAQKCGGPAPSTYCLWVGGGRSGRRGVRWHGSGQKGVRWHGSGQKGVRWHGCAAFSTDESGSSGLPSVFK
eukprot:350636-Chlamydomonas_euryale.AAC.1